MKALQDGLVFARPEVAVATPECPHPEQWLCIDGEASEVEVLEFLYALVRMLKPRMVLETGTYLGYGAYCLACAVRENGFGAVHTAEPSPEVRQRAQQFLQAQGFADVVAVYGCTGEELIARMQAEVDFAFLDSELDTRIGEMRILLPKLSARGIVAVHDGNTFHDRPGTGGPRTPFHDFAVQHDLQLLNLDTPRGLILCRPRKDTTIAYREMP